MTTLAIIEDNAELRGEIAEELRFRGHRVYEAADGSAGYRLIEEIVPDIVLSDIDMPIENGYDLMRRVREGGAKFADLTFIFLSGHDRARDLSIGLKAGADDYITKPIDYDYLASKIDAIARKKDRLFNSWSMSNMGSQFKEAMAVAAMAAAGVVVLGFVALLVIYNIKSDLGIDIFKDVHFSDLFGS